MESHTSAPLYVSSVITVVFNSITCPLTFLLNVLVIMAVKKTSRLQTKTNMLLACLAVTDESTGLLTQPLFIVWKAFYLLEVPDEDAVGTFYFSVSRGLTICSALHLMLVTCERLIAIRFTYHHPHLVTGRNIKVAVIVFWLISISNIIGGRQDFIFEAIRSLLNFSAVLIVVFCVLFIVFAYAILYREVRRQRKNIKNQQLPQEEQQRIAKENKALKTTVLVVGALLVCYVPVILTVVVFYLFGLDSGSCVYCPWVSTFIMFNSFINPLIYCWRQKEMRQYVLSYRFSCTTVVEPLANA